MLFRSKVREEVKKGNKKRLVKKRKKEVGPRPELSQQIQFLFIMPFRSERHPLYFPLGATNKTVLTPKKGFYQSKMDYY